MGYNKEDGKFPELAGRYSSEYDGEGFICNAKENHVNKGTQVHEAIFFKALKKKEQRQKNTEKYDGARIYRKMRVFSAEPLKIPEIRYYKFPFSSDIRNDESCLFRKLYAEWTKSIQNAYSNFKRNCSCFYLKFKNFLVCFDRETKASTNLRSTLNRNEITYIEKDNWLLLEPKEIKLVFDLVTNMPVDSSFEIPFIISKDEFENSICYHTKVKKGPTVKQNGIVNYQYEIEDYFIGHDYSKFFIYDVKLDTAN